MIEPQAAVSHEDEKKKTTLVPSLSFELFQISLVIGGVSRDKTSMTVLRGRLA